MSAADVVTKCRKIRHIVRLRLMVLKWRRKARLFSAASRVPLDVPAGHVAVCVGECRRRFVLRAAHLNNPMFRNLLAEAEEEYGFANCGGPLVIPCNEALFEDVLRLVSTKSGLSTHTSLIDPEDVWRCCQAGSKSKPVDLWTESLPLLFGPIWKSVGY